jgi:hypothetical protein
MADNSNDLDTPDTMLEDGPGTEPKPGPNPSLQDNLKTYKSLKTDSDGSDDDLGQSTGNVNDNMDTGSSDSGMQNTTPSNDNNEDGKVNLKHVNSKQDMDTEDGNLKQANNKQDMVESKTGQISATMNGKENTEMGVEKNAANKEVKLGESGKILETSYRFNDEDTPEVDDFADQGTGGGGYLGKGGGLYKIAGFHKSTIVQQMVVNLQLYTDISQHTPYQGFSVTGYIMNR